MQSYLHFINIQSKHRSFPYILETLIIYSLNCIFCMSLKVIKSITGNFIKMLSNFALHLTAVMCTLLLSPSKPFKKHCIKYVQLPH